MHPEKDNPFDREIAKAIEALRMKLSQAKIFPDDKTPDDKTRVPSQASPVSDLHAYSCRWAALNDHVRAEHDDFLGLKPDDHDSPHPAS